MKLTSPLSFFPRLLLLTSHLSLLTNLFVLPAFSQQTWWRTYGGTSDDQGQSVQQTSDGGYIVAGNYADYTNNPQVYLIKTNASGDTLWTRTYGEAFFVESYSIQQTLDGGYIITGTISEVSNDVWLIKTDPNGDTLWTRTYGGRYRDSGKSVQQTTDGGYIVAGWTYSYGDTVNGDVYLIKTNASGDTLWTRTYGGTGSDYGNSVQQTTDGGYIVAGGTQSYGNGNGDVWLIKTNAQGNTLWARTYGGTGNDWGYSVQQTSDGGYIVAGEAYSFPDSGQVYLV